MTTIEAVVYDLIVRVETSVGKLRDLSADTGVIFTAQDIVDDVERGLPAGYPAPIRTGTRGRRELIARMVRDLLEGQRYDSDEHGTR
jgi:hypothetical protein